MKNSIIIQIFSVLIILISCQEKKEKQILFDEKPNDSTVINSTIKTDSVTSEQRISDIKNWYSDAQNNMKSADKNCKNTEEKWVYKLDKDLKMDFVNKASECILPNGIKVYSGEFNGYEWQQKFSYYFKNDKLFFVYYESAAESCYEENRIYYNENQKPIQFLFKTNDCDGNDATDNKKIEDKNQQNDLMKIVDKHIVEIKRILEQKK